MRTSSRPELQKDLIIHPRLLWQGKKQLLLGVPVLLLFIIGCSFMIIRGENILIYLGAALFFAFTLLTVLIQLTWGPFLIMNEQEIHIRSNPFLTPITLQWDEIASITPFRGTRDFYFDVALSPTHIESFLQRQSSFNKKILSHRLNRIHLVARFPQRLLPCSLVTLLEAIKKRYHTQIQQNHIIIQTQIAL
jgi:hypothetical protein